MCGTSLLSLGRFNTYYEAAARLRAALSEEIRSSLAREVNLLLIPTALQSSCGIGEERMDNTEMFANDIMTVPASLAGLPAMSVPFACSQEHASAAGLQRVSSRLREHVILQVGQILEQDGSRPQHHKKNSINLL